METADYYYQKLFPAKPKPQAWEKYPYEVDGPYVHPGYALRRRVVAFLIRMTFYLAFTAGWVYLLLQLWIDNP